MARLRGRPRGRFEFMVERTRRLVEGLSDHTMCNASDRWFADKLGCSTRSVRRYILALKQRGVIARTTVAFQRHGEWKRRRLMTLAARAETFGMTRDQVLSFKQRGRTLAARAETIPATTLATIPERFEFKRKALPYFEGPVLQDPNEDTWGDPYHEGMKSFGDRPIDAKIVPKTVLAEKIKEIQGWLNTPPPDPPEHTKLRCAYIKASIQRATSNGGLYPVGVFDDGTS